jgi:hypothetical protein
VPHKLLLLAVVCAASWTLGSWRLHPQGDFSEWDGLLHWFLEYCEVNPQMLDNDSIWGWCKAARQVLGKR